MTLRMLSVGFAIVWTVMLQSVISCAATQGMVLCVCNMGSVCGFVDLSVPNFQTGQTSVLAS